MVDLLVPMLGARQNKLTPSYSFVSLLRMCRNWAESICHLEHCGKFFNSTLVGVQLTMCRSKLRIKSELDVYLMAGDELFF